MGLPAVSEHVAFERVGDEVVLVHLRTNQIYALNETGARFWELLARGAQQEEIVAAMTSEFDVDATVLEAEIASLVDELGHAGMVLAA